MRSEARQNAQVRDPITGVRRAPGELMESFTPKANGGIWQSIKNWFSSQMEASVNKALFLEVLENYELPSEEVYEDLSEIGKVLWHNNKLAVKVVCAIEGQPCLSLVVMAPDDDYYNFESKLAGFSSSDVGELIAHVKEHSESIRQSATQAENFICISTSGKESTFNRV